MKEADAEECLKTYRWTQSYLDNTNGRERLHDYVHYVAKVRSYTEPNSLQLTDLIYIFLGFVFEECFIDHGGEHNAHRR